MVEYVNGFQLSVEVHGLKSHVRVCLADGSEVVNTDKVSCAGLENLAEVFRRASQVAAHELSLLSPRRIGEPGFTTSLLQKATQKRTNKPKKPPNRDLFKSV